MLMLYWPEPFEGFARRREAGDETGDIYVAAVYAKAITCGQYEDEPAEDGT